MERDKVFFRNVILHHYDLNKSAAQTHRMIADVYDESAPSKRMCSKWFQRFKKGDYGVEDKERSGKPKKIGDSELLALLDENPTQSIKELSDALDIDKSTVSRRLHAMGKIKKDGKWVSQ